MSSLATNAITDASGGNTTTINGFTPTVSNMAGRNRIINGDMRIDQRNAGASVTPSGSTYTLDRWRVGVGVASGSMSFQQSTDAPSGFTNSIVCTVVTSATPAAGDLFYLQQNIEGYNVSDFGFGTASAKTITVSFWVKSSVTGDKSFSLINGALDRAYCTIYTINSANTWEYKSITIPGDISGVWAKNQTNGLEAHWNFSIGSTFEATANNQWESGRKYATATTTDFISNAGATLYITGVQLEAGSVATPFEHRMYGQELALCQRYCEVFRQNGSDYTAIGSGYTNGTYAFVTVPYMEKRSAPTVTWNSGTVRIITATTATGLTPSEFYNPGVRTCRIRVTTSLTYGWGCVFEFDSASGGYFTVSAEL